MSQKFKHLDKIHSYFAAGNVGSFFGGLAIGDQPFKADVFFFLFICVLLRVKFWIDDLEYFDNVAEGRHSAKRGFYIGLVMAILSWLPWLLAGFNDKNVPLSALFMMLVMLFSTLWVFSTWIGDHPYREQVGWGFYNIIYMVGFFLLWKQNASWFPMKDLHEYLPYAILTVMLVVFLFDLTNSRTLSALASKQEP